jgi:hypothetical protein
MVNMEAYFSELATLLDRSIAPGEVYTCAFDAEASDFVRMNRGRIRQPGSVLQRLPAPASGSRPAPRGAVLLAVGRSRTRPYKRRRGVVLAPRTPCPSFLTIRT